MYARQARVPTIRMRLRIVVYDDVVMVRHENGWLDLLWSGRLESPTGGIMTEAFDFILWETA